MQHRHTVLIPIHLHLCGTNLPVHSWTVNVNLRLVHRTTAACHNWLSNEAGAGYHIQNKDRATGCETPIYQAQSCTKLLNKEHEMRTSLEAD